MTLIKNSFEKSKEFQKIVTETDRTQWRSLIEPLIETVDNSTRCCFIDDTVYKFLGSKK